MGLLNQFSNLNEDQTNGLLAAAAQMLQASGPSLRPTSFGQVAGSGIGAFQAGSQQSRQRRLDEEEAAQIAKMRGLQMQETQGQLSDRENSRVAAQSMAALKAGFNPQAQQAPAEIKLGSTPMNSSMGQPQAAPQSEYQRRMAYANYLRSNGAADEGDAAAKSALDFMPKVKEWSRVRDGGKVKFAPLFDNGTMGDPVDREIAEKLEFRDSGQAIEGIDQYTGEVKSSLGKKQTLESIASNALTARGQAITLRGQDMGDRRARDLNAISQGANGIKLMEKAETAKMTKSSQVASFDTMLGTLGRLSTHPGLPNSVGLRGALPTMPGSDSANFQAELDSFQSQAFIPMVAQLKGMGALSDAEGKKLTAAVGALNPKMGEKAFRESITRITNDMEGARQRVSGEVPNQAKPRSVMKGQVVDGYRFKGGNPADQNNWEKR